MTCQMTSMAMNIIICGIWSVECLKKREGSKRKREGEREGERANPPIRFTKEIRRASERPGREKLSSRFPHNRGRCQTKTASF